MKNLLGLFHLISDRCRTERAKGVWSAGGKAIDIGLIGRARDERPLIVAEPVLRLTAIVEKGFPTRIIIRRQQTVPLSVAIVVQASTVALRLTAPSSKQHAGILLILPFLGLGIAKVTGHLRPCSQS